jgi:hypothetical protein
VKSSVPGEEGTPVFRILKRDRNKLLLETEGAHGGVWTSGENFIAQEQGVQREGGSPAEDEALPQEQEERPRGSGEEILQERIESLKAAPEHADGDPAHLRNEARSQLLAEKFGLTAEREAMLEAEKQYQVAQTEHQRKNVRLPWRFKKGASEVQKHYDEKRLQWRNAAIEKADENVKAAIATGDEAAIKTARAERAWTFALTNRDAILRAEEARIQARQEGLDERSQTPVGKTLKKVGYVAKTPYRWFMRGSEKAGGWFARRKERGSKDENFDTEAHAQKYAQWVRIGTSATLATVLFGGFGALGLGLSAGVRAGRGLLSIAFAARLARNVGRNYDKNRGEVLREEDRAARRLGPVSDGRGMQAAQKAFRRGSAESRAQERKVLQMVAAFLGGAGFSAGTGLAIGSIAGMPSVREAADNLKATPEPPGKPLASDATHAETRGVLNEAVKTLTQQQFGTAEAPASPGRLLIGSKIDLPGEGTDRLFVDLRDEVQANMTPEQLESASPALRHFMSSHPNLISHEVGDAAYGEIGMMTHYGDQFYVDENQNIVYQPYGGQPQMFIENDGQGGYIRHDLHSPHASVQPQEPEQAGARQQHVPERIPEDSSVDTSAPVTPEAPPDATPEVPTEEPVVHRPVVNGQDPNASTRGPLGRALEDRANVDPAVGNDGASPGAEPNANPPRNAPLGRSLEERSRALEDESAPAAQPLSWMRGQDLPEGKSVFTVGENSRLASAGGAKIFYANAENPRAGLDLAYNHGLENRGKLVLFDNTEYDLRGATPRVGGLIVGEDGNIEVMRDQVLDRNGDPVRRIDTNFLDQRIA